MLKKIFGDKKYVADIILVASVLIVALSVFLIAFLTREDGELVVVTVDGVKVAEYSLCENGEYSLNGGTNILVIEDGMAYMKYSDCPGYQDCVEKGKISYTGEKIVCLPNRVMIEIVGAREELIGD